MPDRTPQLRGGVYEAPAGQDLFKLQEEFYALHPDARVTPGENVLYSPQEREEMNVLYGKPSASDNLRNTFLPPNLRAAVGTYFGFEDPLTQHDFLPEDLRKMSDQYLLNRAGYKEHPYDPHMSYNEYTQNFRDMRPVQSFPGLGNVLQSYTDQDYRIAPFTQGAYYEQSPEGTYLVNTYRMGERARPVRVLLPQ